MDCFVGFCIYLCPLILWLTSFIHCKLRQRRDLRTQNGNASSNHTPSASKSQLHRIPTSISRKKRETCPYFAIIPGRTGLQRTDCSVENEVNRATPFKQAVCWSCLRSCKEVRHTRDDAEQQWQMNQAAG
jgi:hypothetical protein